MSKLTTEQVIAVSAARIVMEAARDTMGDAQKIRQERYEIEGDWTTEQYDAWLAATEIALNAERGFMRACLDFQASYGSAIPQPPKEQLDLLLEICDGKKQRGHEMRLMSLCLKMYEGFKI